MKKFVLFIFICLLVVGCSTKKDENQTPQDDQPDEERYLFSLDYYKDFKLEDIVSYESVRLTVGGDQREEYSDKASIESIYNTLSNVKIGKETEMACEDNSTIYIFTLSDGTTKRVEFECDWVIIGKDRYEIVRQ